LSHWFPDLLLPPGQNRPKALTSTALFEYRPQMRIEKFAVWVELPSQGAKAIELGVKAFEFLACPGVSLAPMRPAAHAPENAFAHVE